MMGEDFSGAAGENPYAFNRCRLPHALMTKGLNVGCSLCTWCDSHCLLLDVVKDAIKGRNQVHSSSGGSLVAVQMELGLKQFLVHPTVTVLCKVQGMTFPCYDTRLGAESSPKIDEDT